MARYQEIEIDETHRVHDILKKMERLYIRPYKTTILAASNQLFEKKDVITISSDFNVWDICFPHNSSQPSRLHFGFIVLNMDHFYATLIEYCERCRRWGTHFEKHCDQRIRLIDGKFNIILCVCIY
jgi:hypothetical protein